MASRRKRRPVAFRPAFRRVWLYRCYFLSVVQTDDFSSWLTESNIFWPVGDVRFGSLAVVQHHISRTAAFGRIAVVRQADF